MKHLFVNLAKGLSLQVYSHESYKIIENPATKWAESTLPNTYNHLAQRGGKFLYKFHSKLGKECPNYYWSAKFKQIVLYKAYLSNSIVAQMRGYKDSLIFNKNQHSK